MQNEKRGFEEAIKKVSEPCVILAGAGTGKTYAIVEKIKYLINNRVYEPNKIVCLTFSNEAANNILKRVSSSTEIDIENGPIIKTFHGFSANLLKKYGSKIGLKDDFKILDPDGAKILLHQNLRVPPSDCHRYVAAFSTAKDLGIEIRDLENYVAEKTNFENYENLVKKLENMQFELQTSYLKKEKETKKELEEKIRTVKKNIYLKKFVSVWKAYEKIKKINNYQDYSDLNYNLLNLIRNYSEISNDFSYFLIDEFQDTNKIQLELIFSLAQHNKITIVGDLNQSIYRFRGAYKDNFEIFCKHYQIKEKDIFKLDKSYRSPNIILNNSYKLIINNYSKKEECFPIKNYYGLDGEKIKIFELKNAQEEARKVLEIIEEETKRGTPLEEICVMYRNHQYGNVIKKNLKDKKIPFISTGKKSLFELKQIKLIINYLRVLNSLKKNTKEKNAWWDILYQNNLPETDLINVGNFLKENKESPNLSKLLFENLEKIVKTDVGKIIVNTLFKNIEFLINCDSKNVFDLIEKISSLLGFLKEAKTQEEKEIILSLVKFNELIKKQSQIVSQELSLFLNYIDSIENLGIVIDAPELENKGVRLMTLHATKGLEYKTVIITNMVEGRFPMEKANKEDILPFELMPEIRGRIENLSEIEKNSFIKKYEIENQIFEERRLCYVAFTRARERLFITYAKKYSAKEYEPSRFLKEIEYKENPSIIFTIDESEIDEKIKAREKKEELININFQKEIVEQKQKKKNIKEIIFSPSALFTYKECQKKFEYVYIYNMPEKITNSWQEVQLGSFVHLVLEEGVKNNFKTLKEYIDFAKLKMLEEDWNTLNFDEVLLLIRVFFERNSNKYSEKSKTEQLLKMNLAGLRFYGFADRIDYNYDGIEIVEYKTGKMPLSREKKEWQVSYYALAASSIGKVKKITIDLLRQEKPLEFDLKENGDAFSVHSEKIAFNIYDVKKELIKVANEIIYSYETSFIPCKMEKECEFCREFVYF